MLDRIINILKDRKDISDWKVVQTQTTANELFLTKKQIDMPRSKQVNNITVTVYKDFEEEGKKFRGSSAVNIHPTMTDEEIGAAVKDVAFSASYIKNQYYPIPEKSNVEINPLDSKFSSAPLVEWMPKIKDALYKYDNYDKGYFNSSEIFLNKNITTIINSRGVHYSYTSYKGQIEFITCWKDSGEEIELYKDIMFSDFEDEFLSKAAQEMLEMSKEKASTKPTQNLESFTVILQGEPVAELLKHYYTQSNAQYVYQHISTAKVQESIQGENILGDKINLIIDPSLNNSVVSAPVDDDGIILTAHKLIDNGILQKYWGTSQYCHYLNVEPTGRINNYIFEGGSKTIEEMRSIPHLEIAAFSDFNINPMTGSFAGEIRLGWHYDGKTRVAVSGGSISGNLNNVQTNMYLSKELQQCNAKEVFQPLSYQGPKALMLHNVSVAGI
ncbi:MAG TPA: metallopeptidase TldD-related protein [Patescibacteria group bacterium]|nr:metallopeptidase TldD-related protein [Patescibacteria group bacterium]